VSELAKKLSAIHVTEDFRTDAVKVRQGKEEITITRQALMEESHVHGSYHYGKTLGSGAYDLPQFLPPPAVAGCLISLRALRAEANSRLRSLNDPVAAELWRRYDEAIERGEDNYTCDLTELEEICADLRG
jgi:hypothetical protein